MRIISVNLIQQVRIIGKEGSLSSIEIFTKTEKRQIVRPKKIDFNNKRRSINQIVFFIFYVLKSTQRLNTLVENITANYHTLPTLFSIKICVLQLSKRSQKLSKIKINDQKKHIYYIHFSAYSFRLYYQRILISKTRRPHGQIVWN